MSHDDIDTVVLKLFDFLVGSLGCDLGEDQDYQDLKDFMYDALDPYVTRDRNYN